MTTHPYLALAVLVLGGGLAALLVRSFAKNVRKWKRRKPGVYLVRADHHYNRARRVNAYVGESVNVELRRLQHLGTSRFHPVTGVAKGNTMHKTAAQPWSDLRPVWHWIRLPWWLGWKWFLRSVETLAILLLWPRYNIKKNAWNPLRIDPGQAKLDRRQRDEGSAVQAFRVWSAHLARYAVQGLGVVAILGGLVGFVMTR
jgi:hypothetical protein